MHGVNRVTEQEGIAYRRGFNDGLAVMRERIKGLLLENARLLKPILGPADLPAAIRNRTEPPNSGGDLADWLAQPGLLARFSPMVDGGDDRDPLGPGNGRGQQ